ncbi:MAG: cell division protein FtsX, partial [Wenzhouxiangellaceae bacterium]
MNRKGAVAGELRAWLRRHGYSLMSSIGDLVRAPVASAMTITLLAIALSLPLGLHTTLINLEHLNRGLDRLDSISVFLELEADEAEVRRLSSTVSAWPEVIAVDPISPADGLRELAATTGLAGLDAEDVPLPWVLDVAVGGQTDMPGLAARLQELGGVDTVIIDLEWVRRLEAILALFSRLVQMLAVLFGLSVLFVIAGNVRAEIERRREEIEVMTLVGATPGYIRRPFLYSGFWMGLGGALLAWLLVQGGLLALSGPVRDLAGSYATELTLIGPSPELTLAMLMVSSALGI